MYMLLYLTLMSWHCRMSVIEMMKNKLMGTMEQDQDQLPIQDLGQNPALDHVQDLAQDPVQGLDQDLAPDQIPEIDQGQGVEAGHADTALVAGHIHIHIRGGSEDPDLAVHITIGTKGTGIVLYVVCGNSTVL